MILKALNVSNLIDREAVEGRLLELYSESEQNEKLSNLEKEINQNEKTKNSARTQVIGNAEKKSNIFRNR